VELCNSRGTAGLKIFLQSINDSAAWTPEGGCGANLSPTYSVELPILTLPSKNPAV
jgi:hypothetical protein